MEIEKKTCPSGHDFHRGPLLNQIWTIIVHTPPLHEPSTGVWLLEYQHLYIHHLGN